MTRRSALFALGASSLAIAAVQATDRVDTPTCHRCDRRPADNALEHGVLAPNLEYGVSDDASRVTVDGATSVGKLRAPADATMLDRDGFMPLRSPVA